VLANLKDTTIVKSQKTALRTAASLGIAAVHEMAGPDISGRRDTELLKTSATSDLPEVIIWWGEFGGEALAKELGAVGCGGDLFIDGSIGSKTAAVVEPYSHGDSGILFSDSATISAHLHACIAAGLATGFHAIGDAALELVLRAYEQVFAELGQAVFNSVHHQIEHAEMLSTDHVSIMARLGIAASMQPVFDELWAGSDGMYETRLGDRWTSMNNFAELSRKGVLMSFGSDSPVTPLDPWRAIRAATNPHNPSHAISSRAAFAAHTRSSWRAINRSDIGEIQVGMKANLALWDVPGLEIRTPDHVVRNWSTDPRSATPELPILDGLLPRCLMTFREGTIIYSDGTISS
jgi:predicted amidohydrolase YtcJ